MAEEDSNSGRQRLARKDLLWLLAYPLYQTIGTLRHEASHALAAMLEGASIEQFVFWPTRAGQGFVWGYVEWTGSTTWLTTAAPYWVDLLTFAAFFVMMARISIRRYWLWVNLAVIGLVSPLVNSAYNYIRRSAGANDIYKLLTALPDGAVHAYFLATLTLYLVGLHLILSGKVSPRPHPPQ